MTRPSFPARAKPKQVWVCASTVIREEPIFRRRSGPPDRAAGSLELNSGSGPMDALVVGAQSRCSIPT